MGKNCSSAERLEAKASEDFEEPILGEVRSAGS